MTKKNQFRKKLFTYTKNSIYINYSLFYEFVYSSFDNNKTFLISSENNYFKSSRIVPYIHQFYYDNIKNKKIRKILIMIFFILIIISIIVKRQIKIKYIKFYFLQIIIELKEK